MAEFYSNPVKVLTLKWQELLIVCLTFTRRWVIISAKRSTFWNLKWVSLHFSFHRSFSTFFFWDGHFLCCALFRPSDLYGSSFNRLLIPEFTQMVKCFVRWIWFRVQTPALVLLEKLKSPSIRKELGRWMSLRIKRSHSEILEFHRSCSKWRSSMFHNVEFSQVNPYNISSLLTTRQLLVTRFFSRYSQFSLLIIVLEKRKHLKVLEMTLNLVFRWGKEACVILSAFGGNFHTILALGSSLLVGVDKLALLSLALNRPQIPLIERV